MINFSSKLIENAVNEISKMPGIGKKSAFRMVLHLLRKNREYTISLTDSILELKNNIKNCAECHNVSDNDICSICANFNRDDSVICVVENIQDVIAIENTNQYKGSYHVLGGSISPIYGVNPDDLNIDSLIRRVEKKNFSEIIFALSTTIEGDTTAFYIKKRLKDFPIKTTVLSRGVSIGGELEYTDEVTLGKSIINRVSSIS